MSEWEPSDQWTQAERLGVVRRMARRGCVLASEYKMLASYECFQTIVLVLDQDIRFLEKHREQIIGLMRGEN